MSRGWTELEDARLIELRRAGKSYRQAADELGRPFSSVRCRAMRIGLSLRLPEGWGGVRGLMVRAASCSWEIEILAALLAASDVPEAAEWREQLIHMAVRCDEMRRTLAGRVAG